jgi:hypothetical protein
MEISASDIISIVSLLVGGGGIGVFFTWRWSQRKEKADAVTAEVGAVKEVQDVYQQLISDIKTDRGEQRQYTEELKEDRQRLREENSELRERLDKTDERVRKLEHDVARNGRMVETMRPFLCGDLKCKMRQRVVLKAESKENEELEIKVNENENENENTKSGKRG